MSEDAKPDEIEVTNRCACGVDGCGETGDRHDKLVDYRVNGFRFHAMRANPALWRILTGQGHALLGKAWTFGDADQPVNVLLDDPHRFASTGRSLAEVVWAVAEAISTRGALPEAPEPISRPPQPDPIG